MTIYVTLAITVASHSKRKLPDKAAENVATSVGQLAEQIRLPAHMGLQGITVTEIKARPPQHTDPAVASYVVRAAAEVLEIKKKLDASLQSLDLTLSEVPWNERHARGA